MGWFKNGKHGGGYAGAYGNDVAVVHVRFSGRSFDIPLAELDLSIMSDDVQVKRQLAHRLGVHEMKLDPYVVDRHTNGNLTVRPEAVFG